MPRSFQVKDVKVDSGAMSLASCCLAQDDAEVLDDEDALSSDR